MQTICSVLSVVLLLFNITVLVFSQNTTLSDSCVWSYGNDTVWTEQCFNCNGTRQSPINIDSFTTWNQYAMTEGSSSNILYFFPSNTYTTRLLLIQNTTGNGKYSFELQNIKEYIRFKSMEETTEGKASSTLFLSRSFLVRNTNNSRWNEITNNYYLQNIHFHSPSEHALYGRFYDLEMHMVFLNPNTPNDTPKTVVIGKLYQAVDNDFYTSPLIETVIKNYNALLKENGDESEKTIVQLDGSTLHGLIEFTPSYYVYNGSLTTPNCIENVMWHVINDIGYINIPQLTSIKKLLNQIHYVNFTQGNYSPEQYLPDARQVQPRNNRPIIFISNLFNYFQ